MLRGGHVDEDVMAALRVAEITTRGLFVSLDMTEEGLEASANEAAFGIDPAEGFSHMHELCKLTQA